MFDHGTGDYPSKSDTDTFIQGFGCLFRFLVLAGIVAGLNWLVVQITGRGSKEWFGLLLVGAAVSWVAFLIFCVPVLGLIALVVGKVLDFQFWREHRAKRKKVG